MLQSKLLHIPARLACVRHAASVRPEPGSNSRVESCIESRKCYLPSSKLISELTVSLDMTRENHVRVLLDSVSFSRIICQPLAYSLALTAQLVYCALRFLSIPFFKLFCRKSAGNPPVAQSPGNLIIGTNTKRYAFAIRSNETVIVVPRPSSLSTEIVALCLAAMCLTMASPRPVPPVAFERLLSTR